MDHRCSSCGGDGHGEFDAEKAYRDLELKHTLLADMVARYMAEADMKRPGRVKNAHAMSASIRMEIIGGDTAPVGFSPECCLVGEVNPSGQFRWYCTGVLIHPGAVLTAAHCFNPEKNMRPNVVALNTRSVAPVDMQTAEVIRLKKAPIRHPLYSPFSKTNDIAVMILSRAAATPAISIANSAETIQSTGVRVVGFGSNVAAGNLNSGLKRFVDIPIHYMRRTPQENLNGVEVALGFESDLEFVAGGAGHDACFGDSGGPAYVTADGQDKVAGLVSRTVQNALSPCGSGGIFTRLDRQTEFIESVLGANDL